MKKKWIAVKRGLIRDPKHRQAMGECIWLFEYLLDIADWDDGIVHDWKDEAGSEDMAMPIRTLREQRRKLDELGYITSVKRQYSQDIVVHNWTDPREYTGRVYNKKQGGSTTEPSDDEQSDTQSDTQSSSQDVTPTSNPHNHPPLTGGLTEEELRQANAKVSAIIEGALRPSYPNREKIPEPYLPYSDSYVRLTGQQPTKRVLSDWLMTFSEWQSEGLTVAHIEEAFKYAIRPDGGFLVRRPGSLTSTAVAMKTKAKAQTHEPISYFTPQEGNYVPNPRPRAGRGTVPESRERPGNGA